MRRVVFLYNELLDEDYQKQLKLPLEFVCFAYINGAVMCDIKGKYCALKENDLSEGTMNNNIMLELAKEIMARKIAMACKDGFKPNDSEINLLLEEEREMNKFNTSVIDKIINVYGKEIKVPSGAVQSYKNELGCFRHR